MIPGARSTSLISPKLPYVLLLVLTALLAGCGGGGGNGNSPSTVTPAIYEYEVPVVEDDGWAVSHLTDQNIDIDLITAMMNEVVQQRVVGIDSISIVRNNNLVLNENLRTRLDQFDAWINNTDLERHILHSTSKSFTAALIGIAIKEGYISNTDVPFYGMFLYPSYDNWDARKATMTLDDALTMQFGYEWDEWSVPYGQLGNSLYDLTEGTSDHAKALLDLPLVADPGTEFAYNTAGTIAIGQALDNVLGLPMEVFAELSLFAPLQIDDAEWGTTPTGLPNGGSGLFLSTRSMVKFGQLFIAGGVWQGQQIISAEWVDRSVEPRTLLPWDDTSGYGYQWWIDRLSVNGEPIESYSTRGYGGQIIICVPSLQLVVAFTGQNYGGDAFSGPIELMEQYILPAME